MSKRKILFNNLSFHNINYDEHFIDDDEKAFDAIEEAMEEHAENEAMSFASWIIEWQVANPMSSETLSNIRKIYKMELSQDDQITKS